MLEITVAIAIPDHELEFSFSRSSGAGGQNVNKVNSKATLRWNAVESTCLPPAVRTRFLHRFRNRLTEDGEIVITSQRHRDQPQNIEDCKDKLMAMVREVLFAPKKRIPTKPSRAKVAKRVDDKRSRSNRKKLRQRPFDD